MMRDDFGRAVFYSVDYTVVRNNLQSFRRYLYTSQGGIGGRGASQWWYGPGRSLNDWAGRSGIFSIIFPLCADEGKLSANHLRWGQRPLAELQPIAYSSSPTLSRISCYIPWYGHGLHILLNEYLGISYRPDREYVDVRRSERNVGKWEHARLQWLLPRGFLRTRNNGESAGSTRSSGFEFWRTGFVYQTSWC